MASHIHKPPQQERSRKATDALLRAGLKGIEARGIDALSMADVAAEAGASIGSLYFRFGDKSQFVGAALAIALDDFRDRGLALCELAARQKWSERRALERWVSLLVAVVRQRRTLVKEMIRHVVAQPNSWAPINERRRELEDKLFSVLAARRNGTRDTAWDMRLRIGLQAVGGCLVHMLVIDPGPLRIDDPSVEVSLCELLFSYIDRAGMNAVKKPGPKRRRVANGRVRTKR
jgi:AcrR family transcriptional regulator